MFVFLSHISTDIKGQGMCLALPFTSSFQDHYFSPFYKLQEERKKNIARLLKEMIQKLHI